MAVILRAVRTHHTCAVYTKFKGLRPAEVRCIGKRCTPYPLSILLHIKRPVGADPKDNADLPGIRRIEAEFDIPVFPDMCTGMQIQPSRPIRRRNYLCALRSKGAEALVKYPVCNTEL